MRGSRFIIRDTSGKNRQIPLKVTLFVRVQEHKSSQQWGTACTMLAKENYEVRLCMSIKIVFLGVMPEGAVEPVPARLLNVGGYPFPHVALYPTTKVLIVPRRLGTAIAAMIRIIRMTSKSSINEKPRSRVRSAFGRPGCAVVLMVRDPFLALVKKKGRKRIFLPWSRG